MTALLISWDVFDFEGPNAAALRADPLKPMRTRDKTLCVAQQFDSNDFLHDADYLPQDEQGQLRHWQAGLLAALDGVATLPRAPKDFDLPRCRANLAQLMDAYAAQLGH